MWKLVVGFILFAAVALYFLSKGGDIDMGGEKHGVESHEPAASAVAAPASDAAASAPVAASAASGS